MLVIELPWPVAALSPNSRDRWAMIRAKKSAKNYAWGMTKAAMGPLKVSPASWTGDIAVHMDFFPSMDRGRDEDNFIASMKAALDGIASALGVDDKRFRLSSAFQPKSEKARVRVAVMPALVSVEVRGGVE